MQAIQSICLFRTVVFFLRITQVDVLSYVFKVGAEYVQVAGGENNLVDAGQYFKHITPKKGSDIFQGEFILDFYITKAMREVSQRDVKITVHYNRITVSSAISGSSRLLRAGYDRLRAAQELFVRSKEFCIFSLVDKRLIPFQNNEDDQGFKREDLYKIASFQADQSEGKRNLTIEVKSSKS